MTAPAQGWRYLIVLAVVGAWMMAGFAFRLNPNAYLLTGVPLLLVFQTLVARRPMAEVWFKPPGGAPLPWWGWLVAVAFMLVPLQSLVQGWARSGWSSRLWFLCAIAGAVPLAYSLARFSRAALKPLLWCFATAGALSVAVMVGTAVFQHLRAAGGPATFPIERHSPLFIGTRSFLLYLPVSFLLEEVFFRGGMDGFLHRPGDRNPWLSAAFISVLWGLWHLPVIFVPLASLGRPVSPMLVVFSIVWLPLIHCVPGIPFSLCWRRSGLLFVPAVVHAFIDGVRNALPHWH